MESFDYGQLDPGVRETVRRLRAWGFSTTDSGDGVSKLGDGADVMDLPHVFCVVRPEDMIVDANLLMDNLATCGIFIQPNHMNGGPWIECSYDPVDNIAIIALLGVKDSDWIYDSALS